ncbi:MAG: bifunctional UDP-N-acetylglucosamine diphosphorylase/glucosamine-1-phosphate N-acetyltransferase GlmU [Alphaproteobacteria bacterium]|nr:bifunctional UDP-N-acetylglucosamine diphosphorylase/glucosamine-1-phosphate N-acetyltransferase GlmU [Alphaproteobacteria bacterium]
MTQTNSSAPSRPVACIVLAAGQGTRMKSSLPKVMHKIAGLPLVTHVIRACEGAGAEKIVTIIAPTGMEQVAKTVHPHATAIQQKPLGTGDAAKAGRETLGQYQGEIIVLFGDAPLVTAASLQALRQRQVETGADLVTAGFYPDDPAQHGRLVVNADGELLADIEFADATDEQKQIRLCNGGIMLFGPGVLWPLLDRLRDDNAKHEFYLTDCIALARVSGHKCAVAVLPADEVPGINNRIELADAERMLQNRLRRQAMLAGVTMTDPDSVFLSADTRFGRDVTIGPNVFIGPGVEIGDNVDIRAFCYLEQARVEPGALIGPYARLRPGSVVGEEAHVGNFVELKNAAVAAGAKVNHLSYIGDAIIGAKANVGAGTITCNYDGYRKHLTEIGAGAFIGSNSALVAPVKIGDGAFVAAGSVITMEVPANTLAVARGRQTLIGDWVERFHAEQKERQSAEKAAKESDKKD